MTSWDNRATQRYGVDDYAPTSPTTGPSDELVGGRLHLPATADGVGAFPAAKVIALVAGMAAGADSIDDMDRLRHGAMDRLFTGVRAPSALGSFLRAFAHGHVKQLHAVARRLLPQLAVHTPLLPGAAVRPPAPA